MASPNDTITWTTTFTKKISEKCDLRSFEKVAPNRLIREVFLYRDLFFSLLQPVPFVPRAFLAEPW